MRARLTTSCAAAIKPFPGFCILAAHWIRAASRRAGQCREAIFEDDTDRESFIGTLAQASKRAGWLIHAYVLMGNHYHLLVETPEPNLVRGMTWFQTTYTQMGSVANVTRASKAIEHRLAGERKLKRIQKEILANISSDPYSAWTPIPHVYPWRSKGPWFVRRKNLMVPLGVQLIDFQR